MTSKISSPVSNSGLTYTVSTTSSAYGNITVPAGGYLMSNGSSANWATTTVSHSHPSLQVTGDAEIDGKLTVGGKDIATSLEAIEKRLAILVPDPAKLEHFESLRKAYDHYKLMEALCDLPTKKE